MTTIESGTRLGRYELLERIGAGGMGEVYKAHDERLGRAVAVKVLSPRWIGSSAAKRRFEREARAISSINHPHICAMYDVGSDGDTDFLVMELLEGETLAERLTRGPLPIDEALSYGRQIANALEHAHRRGIVHRDLKPANVMLTRSGAKLLDFGLARLGELTAEGSITDLLTSEATVIGTFEYMAPEQLNGESVDARTDLFALGVVLYEMLTGERPFRGANRTSVIAAILVGIPRPVIEVDPAIPAALDHLIRALLQKDPEQRLQTAHDVALQLQWLAEGAPADRVPRRSRKRRFIPMLAAALLLTAMSSALLTALYVARPRSTYVERVAFSIVAPVKNEELTWASLSPNGRQLVFVSTGADGRSSLWLREMGNVTVTRLPGTEGATEPFWSPESDSIAFFAQSRLKTIDLRSNIVRVLAPASSPRGGCWGRGGTILFVPHIAIGVQQIPAIGGQAVPLTTLDTARAEGTHRWPELLPDGEHFVFVIGSGNRDHAGLYLGSLHARGFRRISANTNRAMVSSAGDLLFVQNGTLYAQHLDVKAAALTGEPRVVVDRLSVDTKLTGGSLFSVARNGSLVSLRVPQPQTQFTYFDRGGRPVGVAPVPPGQWVDVSISPDERYLAAGRIDANTGKESAWKIDLQTGATTRAVIDSGDSGVVGWSLDQKKLYFTSNRTGRWMLYEKDVAGSGDERLFYAPRNFATMYTVTPRGALIIDQDEPAFSYTLLRPDGSRQKLQIQTDASSAALSPDGNWIAYNSKRLGSGESGSLIVQSIDHPDRKFEIDSAGVLPTFHPNGKELFYVSNASVLMSVPFSPPLVGQATPLFHLDILNLGYSAGDYIPLRDGRFLVNLHVDTGERATATVLVGAK